MFFFFMQKTSYEMRISDCSSDLCSSDLHGAGVEVLAAERVAGFGVARTGASVLEAARLAAALEEAVGDQRILANARLGAAGAAHADRPILEDRMIVAGAGRATHEGDVAAQPEELGAQAGDEALARVKAGVARVVGDLVADAGAQRRALLRADQQRSVVLDVGDLAILQRVAHHVAHLVGDVEAAAQRAAEPLFLEVAVIVAVGSGAVEVDTGGQVAVEEIGLGEAEVEFGGDRKSTRLNSSH